MWFSKYSMMAFLSSATLLKAPRRMRFRVIWKEALHHVEPEAEVGVKWRWKRGCALSQRLTGGVLWAA